MSAPDLGMPTKVLRALLRALLGRGTRGDTILGDLDHEYAELCESRSPAAARRWYRRQVRRVIVSYALPRLLGLLPRVAHGIEVEESPVSALASGLSGDLRYAFRRLLRRPVPAAAAIATLAIAIGGNTAVYSVVDAVLVEPLPYPEADRMVQVWETNPERVAENELDYRDFGVNILDYEDYRAGSPAFQELAWYVPHDRDMTFGGGDGPTEKVTASSVSTTLFDVLGVQPARGRGFLEEDRPPPDVYRHWPVVIISHDLWLRRFGGDPDVLGAEVLLDAGPSTVVGVLPPGFVLPPISMRGLVRQPEADVLTPLIYEAYYQPRSYRQLFVVGRLAPGWSAEAAEGDLGRIAAGIEESHPDARSGWHPEVSPIGSVVGRAYSSTLYALMGAVSFVLLIACANLANLLLALGTERRAELAVRTALGSGRRRLVRQLLSESMVLAALGGAAGIAFAWIGTKALTDLIPESIPRAQSAGMDGRVLLFAVALTLVTGLVFGLVPALRSSGVDVNTMLKAGGSGARLAKRAGGSSRVLITAQVGLTLVLLTGASLLTKSFVRLGSEPTGFDPTSVLIAEVYQGFYHEFQTAGHDVQARWEQLYELEDALDALPGVVTWSMSSDFPFVGTDRRHSIQFEKSTGSESPERLVQSGVNYVKPGYFQTMGIEIVRGTGLPEWDRGNDWRLYAWNTRLCERLPDPEHCVVVVSEAFAEAAWPREDPLGKELGIYGCCWRVAGVVRDVRDRGLDDPRPAREYDYARQIYIPMSGLRSVLLRTGPEPRSLAPAVQAAVQGVDERLAVTFTTMEERLNASLARPRFYLTLVSLFGGVAFLLSLLGLYGVVAYAVGRRTREIGMRMALGAQREDVRGMIVRQAMGPVLLGIVLGVGGALGLASVLETLLFGMDPVEPALFGSIAAGFAVVAAGASYLPARRASSVDPVRALGAE